MVDCGCFKTKLKRERRGKDEDQTKGEDGRKEEGKGK